MEAMICKLEEGSKPEFFDCGTLDDLLDVLDKYGYPNIQITTEDDEHGNPRLSIEILNN